MAAYMEPHVEAALAARPGLLAGFVALKEAQIDLLELKLRYVDCPADAHELIERIEYIKMQIEEMKFFVDISTP